MSVNGAAYKTFLRTSTLQEWLACLDSYRWLIDGGGPVTPDEALEPLCISVYVRWLSSLCAEDAIQVRTRRDSERLCSRVAFDPTAPSDQHLLTTAVIAASSGYHSAAKRVLKELKQQPPVEITLLVMADDPSARVRELDPYVSKPRAEIFLPAVYFHASALFHLGYFDQARKLLKPYQEAFGDNSLLIDLQGKDHELAGAWREAKEAYKSSDWIEHRYRKMICGIIAGDASAGVLELMGPEKDKFIRGMLDFDPEIDRAAVARSLSFVNACRWHNFDNWLVSFELGRLCFQRRRHSEAERHFKLATERAPEEFLFAVQSLRFTNLTWLNDMTEEDDLMPELLECAHAALETDADEDEKTNIRTFVNRETGEASLLEPVLRSNDHYQRGRANRFRNETPAAIEDWCACIRRSYTPRAFHELIWLFSEFGFEETAHSMAGVILEESWESFFELWDLGCMLNRILQNPLAKRLDQRLFETQLEDIGGRLLELVESEFQNAIRAYDFFSERKRPAETRYLLECAEKLAESPEEYLMLAKARRIRFKGGLDPVGLEHLDRAQRESKDRLERLQVALEFVRYGQLPRARSILQAEGILLDTSGLTPYEYVVALKCGTPCLTVDEFNRLGKLARQSLQHDIAAGLFKKYAEEFSTRLGVYVDTSGLYIDVPMETETEHDEESIWRTLHAELERVQLNKQVEQERQLLRRHRSNLKSQFDRYSLWGWVFDQFDSDVRYIDSLRPDFPDSETPISRCTPGVRVRARTLSELWRRHLLAVEPSVKDQALNDIRTFMEEERELDERWLLRRSAEIERPANRLAYLADDAAALLETIDAGESSGQHWPFFLPIKEAARADTRRLSLQLLERLKSVRSEREANRA